MNELRTFLIACIAVALTPSGVLRLLRPLQSWWRNALVSAAIMPAIVLAICLRVYLDAANGTPEECGVDACGMAMGFAMVDGLAALGGFAAGATATHCFQYLLPRQ